MNSKVDSSFKKQIILLVLFLLFANHSFAGIYKWTDQQGKVHFSDKAPVDQESSEIEVKVNTYEAVSYDRSLFNTGQRVVIYSTSWCGHCKAAKKYFKRKGIKFTDYDIEKSGIGKRQYKKMGAKGVPVILVGDKRMNGFSEAGFEAIYRN
jgi:glutaredoxin